MLSACWRDVIRVRYDRKRGCYILGSHTDGGFQKKLYDEPNFTRRLLSV